MKSTKSTPRFLPFDRYTIHSPLSEEEAMKRIHSITKINKSFNQNIFKKFNEGSGYEGLISERNFKISRIISYRNSFLPVIRGTVSSGPGGTEIHISMRMYMFVMIFMGIWLVIPGLISFGVLLVVLNAMLQLKFHLLKFPMLIPVFFFLFGYLLMFFAFNQEAKRSKKDLDELFEAK